MNRYQFTSENGEVLHARAPSDLNGDVEFRTGEGEFRLPGKFLRNIVADWVERRRISALEQADPDDVLMGRAK